MWSVTVSCVWTVDYRERIVRFSRPLVLFSLFIVFGFFFSALSISEVFEDYISVNNLKNVANRLLYLSAIIIPLITIIILFNLN